MVKAILLNLSRKAPRLKWIPGRLSQTMYDSPYLSQMRQNRVPHTHALCVASGYLTPLIRDLRNLLH